MLQDIADVFRAVIGKDRYSDESKSLGGQIVDDPFTAVAQHDGDPVPGFQILAGKGLLPAVDLLGNL